MADPFSYVRVMRRNRQAATRLGAVAEVEGLVAIGYSNQVAVAVVAQRVGVHPRTIWRWCELTSWQPGSRVHDLVPAHAGTCRSRSQ